MPSQAYRIGDMSNPHTRNITRAFRASSDADRAEGMAWYDVARGFARMLDADSDVNRAAGVIAALSPMLSWPRNMAIAEMVYNGETNLPCLKGNAAKAIAIYNGADPLDILSGNKVRSFYLNIIGSNSDDTVTIDRHAIDAACGKAMSDIDRAIAIGGKNGYGKVREMYIRAARILSKEMGEEMSPAQLQAIVWVYWRKNHAKAFHG